MLAIASSLAAAFVVGHGAPLAHHAASRSSVATVPAVLMSSPVAQAGDDDSGCELIGEEVATGTEWWKCEEGDESPGGDAACKEEEFGTGGGPGILPQDGQVLCKVEKQQEGPLGFIQNIFSNDK